MHTPLIETRRDTLRRTHERLVMANGVADRNLVLVAFGDSVTAGFTAPGHIDQVNVYHAVFRRWLVERFPQAVVSVINAGRGGDAVVHALERVERDVVVHQPDLAIVSFGLNDHSGGSAYLPVFRDGLSAMVDRIRACERTDIILLTPNPVQADGRGQRDLEDYVNAIRDLAQEKGVALADAYATWHRRLEEGVPASKLLTGGTNRPSTAGHQVIADTLARLFDRLVIPSSGR